MLNVLRFQVPGEPHPKLRARSGVIKKKGCDGTKREDYRAITFNEKRNETEEGRIWPYCMKAMHEQRIEKATGPVVLYVLASFLLPKSISKKERIERLWHVQVPDKDNLEKIVADALKGVAWEDDCTVTHGSQAKTWSMTWEGYEVWIAQLPKDPAGARAAFADLRTIASAFLDRFEELTFAGRVDDDAASLTLAGI